VERSPNSTGSVLVMVSLALFGCSNEPTQTTNKLTSNEVPIQQGDLAHHGGTPTIRKSFTRQVDDPSTTNDESNDQPVGHLGTVTLEVHNVSSGNSYPLDADVEGNEVKRIYFPKGGWVDFNESEIDASGNGRGTDEESREWEFEGTVSGTMPSEQTDEEMNESNE